MSKQLYIRKLQSSFLTNTVSSIFDYFRKLVIIQNFPKSMSKQKGCLNAVNKN